MAALRFVQQIERGAAVFVSFAGVADHERDHREQIVAVQDRESLDENARPFVDGEGDCVPGIIRFAMGTEAVSVPMSGDKARCWGCVLTAGI